MPPAAPLLRFRAPGWTLDLGLLLARALPALAGEARAALLRAERVRLGGADGEPVASARVPVPPGTLVVVLDGGPDDALRASLDARAEAEDEGAARAWRAIVATPFFVGGELGEEPALRVEVVLRRGALSELELTRLDGGPLPAAEVRAALEGVGHPVLADVARGGILVDGGLRLRRAELEEPPLWWPYDPAFAGVDDGSAPPSLAVSRATQRVLERGHPWVLRDTETGSTEGLAPGALARLVAPGEARVGWALVEGEPEAELAARRVAGADEAPPELASRVDAALQRREAEPPGLADPARRWLHGEGDGLPGLACDRLGPALRLLVSSPVALGFLDEAREALRERIGADAPLIEVRHPRRRPPGRLAWVRLVGGGERLAEAEREALAALERAGVPEETRLERSGPGRILVREGALELLVDLGLAEPERPRPGVGLFLDQRANRARLAALAAERGGAWLNLFAHTGAFSVALLAAGAERVVSVDLSPAYLRWCAANVALNVERGADPRRHVEHVGEGRRYLERVDAAERFEGIVIDPPTAAAAGRRFWSNRRDLAPLVELALARLAPGGHLLLARNDRAVRDDDALVEWVERRARSAGARLDRCERAPAGADFPSLEGFPEGDPFRGVLVRLR